MTLEGFDRILTMLDPARARREVESAVTLATATLRDMTKKMPPVSASRTGYGAKGIPVAPKHGGTLRQQIRSRKLGVLMGEVYGGARYTGHVHDGTSKMPARPFFNWVLQDFGGNDAVRMIVESALKRLIDV